MVLISAILGNIQGSQAKNRFLVPLEVIWLKILFSKNFLEFSQMAKNMFFSWLHKNVEILPLWGGGPTMVSFHEKGEKTPNLYEIWYRVVWYQNKTFL